jgi:hypothetical protein
MAAPIGTWLGYHTLMPLPGLVMTPVTLAFGPSASYNLLSVACPGLLCYAMYRAARLWLPPSGAVAAGAFFGFSPILAWRSWYEVNLALGALFFPLALAAAVRLRRDPGRRRAVVLGLILGAAVLTDQESAVLAAILTGLALLPWLLPRPQPAKRVLGDPGLPWGLPWRAGARLRATALAAAVAAVVASPQIAVMALQGRLAGSSPLAEVVARDYTGSGAGLGQMFAFSPRVASYGLTWLARPYYQAGPANLVVVAYGSVLSVLALLGIAVAWRRHSARLLALLWLGCTVLALGTAPWLAGARRLVPFGENWHGVRVSSVMPFTWLIQLPGMADMREADRFTELGLVGAALLAGAGMAWLAARARPVLVVAIALALLEAGWSGNPPLGLGTIGTMPTSMPALERPIAADHSGSIVVAVPLGIRGGLPVLGGPFPPQVPVLATADHHPLADAFISRIPARTRNRIRTVPFYAALLQVQGGLPFTGPAELPAARASARRLRIGWVVNWEPGNSAVAAFLRETGFRLAYRADGAAVYRLRHPPRPAPAITEMGQRHRRAARPGRPEVRPAGQPAPRGLPARR